MEEATARRLANTVLAAAAAIAAYYIVRDPRLRRAAWQLIKLGVTTTLPAYLSQEVRTAWVESGKRPGATPERAPI